MTTSTRNFKAATALYASSDKYEERIIRTAQPVIEKLERMAWHIDNDDLAAARQVWHRNKSIRYLVPSAVQRLLFPQDYKK